MASAKQPANDPAVAAQDAGVVSAEALARVMAEQGITPFTPDGIPTVGPKVVDPGPSETTEITPVETETIRRKPLRAVPPEPDGELKPLPVGYREHIELQSHTGTWAAGYTRRNETDAMYLGDDFASEDDARRAVRNEASADDAF